jgi:hypothetical protein
VQDALGQAVLAAVQDDRTVTDLSPLADAAFSAGSSSTAVSSGSGSSTAPTYSMTDPTVADLQGALGTWADGLGTSDASAPPVFPPDCLQTAGSQSGTGASVGGSAFVQLNVYASADAARTGLTADESDLAGCGFTTTTPSDGVLVATRAGDHSRTLWFLAAGDKVVLLQVVGWTDPPQSVTDAVTRLLTTAVATATPDPPATGSASAPVQQTSKSS